MAQNFNPNQNFSNPKGDFNPNDNGFGPQPASNQGFQGGYNQATPGNFNPTPNSTQNPSSNYNFNPTPNPAPSSDFNNPSSFNPAPAQPISSFQPADPYQQNPQTFGNQNFIPQNQAVTPAPTNLTDPYNTNFNDYPEQTFNQPPYHSTDVNNQFNPNATNSNYAAPEPGKFDQAANQYSNNGYSQPSQDSQFFQNDGYAQPMQAGYDQNTPNQYPADAGYGYDNNIDQQNTNSAQNFNQAPDNYDYQNYQQFNDQQQDFQQPGLDPNQKSTFEVKKNGNKMMLIGVVALIVVLLIASVVLFIVNQARNQTSTSSSSSSSAAVSESASSDTGSSQANQSTQSSGATSSDATTNVSSASQTSLNANQKPSDAAKIRSATSIPSDWLRQKFFNNGIDSAGSCGNISVCGESADPDNDNLTNIDEYNYDGDPVSEDIDGDGLSDGDETLIYNTSLKQKDSDGDGVDDLNELLACSDPISAISSKMNATRLDNISSATQFKSLSEKTKQTFKNRNGTDSDIEKGFFQSACNVNSIDLGQ